MKKLILSVAACALLAGCGSNNTNTPLTQGLVNRQLTLLHYNNPDSAMLNAGPGLEEFGGAARFATVVENLRAQSGGSSLLVSAGDGFLPSSQFDISRQNGVPFYDAVAQQLFGVQASAVGNQELDFGPEVLVQYIDSFSPQIPFLSANLGFQDEPELAGRVVPRALVDVNGVRVGLVGLTTPSILFNSTPRNVTVDQDLASAVQSQVDLSAAEGVDIVILLSHLDSLQDTQTLLQSLRNVDIVVAASPFELLANSGDALVPGDESLVVGEYPLIATDAGGGAVPIVNVGDRYKYVGRLRAEFDFNGRLVSSSGGPIRVTGGAQPDAVLPDPEVDLAVTQPVAAALQALESQIVATSQVALDARFSSSYVGETNLGDLTTDAMLSLGQSLAGQFGATPPDVAILNSGAIPVDTLVPAGNLTAADVNSLFPFASFLSIVEPIPASQLKELLENGVSRVEAQNPRFPQVAGMSFTFDPNGTAQQVDADGNVIVAGTRIQELTLTGGTVIVQNGQVVPNAPDVGVATLNFLTQGGDQYPFRGAPATNVGLTYREAFLQFVSDNLSGTISSADYPEGGEGRITSL